MVMDRFRKWLDSISRRTEQGRGQREPLTWALLGWLALCLLLLIVRCANG